MNTLIDDILQLAAARGASRVLFMVGHAPVIRVEGALEPLEEQPLLSFYDTQEIARQLLSEQQDHALDENGSVELPFEIGQVRGSVTIFYGQGSHQIVFYLDQPPK